MGVNGQLIFCLHLARILANSSDFTHQLAKYLKAIKSPFLKGIFGAYSGRIFKNFASIFQYFRLD